MRSNNPVLTSIVRDEKRSSQNFDPYAGYGQPAMAGGNTSASSRPITVDDVVTKTGITLAVIIAASLVNVAIATQNPNLAMGLTFVGMIVGLGAVLVSSFKKSFGSAPLTLTYAVAEGFFVGGISLVLSGWMVGRESAGSLIGQAILGTVGVFIGMLFVYKTGAVKVTPKFNRILTGVLFGVVVLALGNVLMALFTGSAPLTNGGPIAIIFSLACIVIAALTFLSDFDLADTLIRQGAPAHTAWGVALGLAVTLVWLYTEILRLLSYFQQR